ncbi:MAG TPA: ATP-binding protein [Solirubrobacterales bacterium]|nr:ATP-binding protein [Solirubrobacterales bacterium]
MELAQVAAGLPVAASFALAGGITSFREGRRRAGLNEAMHELRRPLQVLSLALPVDSHRSPQVESSLELATVALERLDREINGEGLEKISTEVSVNALIAEAATRWHGPARDSGRRLSREWNGPETYVEGDRFELAQALDNLLNNAIEHGAGEVAIGWRREGEWVCVTVSNSCASSPVQGRRLERGGRRRRGHGLRVVQRVARRHGGSFVLHPARGGVKASLQLPLLRRDGAG